MHLFVVAVPLPRIYPQEDLSVAKQVGPAEEGMEIVQRDPNAEAERESILVLRSEVGCEENVAWIDVRKQR